MGYKKWLERLEKKDQKRFAKLLTNTDISEFQRNATKEERIEIIKWIFEYAEEHKETCYKYGLDVGIGSYENCGTIMYQTYGDEYIEYEARNVYRINTLNNRFNKSKGKKWFIANISPENTSFSVRIFTNKTQDRLTQEFLFLASCEYHIQCGQEYHLDYDTYIEREQYCIDQNFRMEFIPTFRTEIASIFKSTGLQEFAATWLETATDQTIEDILYLAKDELDLCYDDAWIDFDPIYQNLDPSWFYHQMKGCDYPTMDDLELPKNECLFCGKSRETPALP